MSAFRRLALAAAIASISSGAFAAQCELNVWEDIQKSMGIADAVAAFEQETGCKVNMLEIPYAQQTEKLRLDGPAGIGPDVLLMPHDQLGSAVVQGLIAPLNAAPEALADYTETSLAAFTTDGQLYGYPKVVETLVMYYNKDEVKAPLENMDDYYKLSQQIHSADANKFGLIAKYDEIYYAYGALAPYGAYIFSQDADGNYNVSDIGLNNAGAVEAVTYIKKFYDEGLFPAGILGENGLNAIDSLFTEKRAAAVINGPWAYEPYTKAGVNFGVAPLPKMPNGKEMSSLMGVKGYVLSSWVRDQELAEKFIQFINKPEWAKKRFELTSEIPPLKSVMADPVIKDNEFANAVAVQAARATPMPSIPEMSEVWVPINAALQLSVSGKQDPKEALDGAVEQINNQIEAFRAGM